MRSKILRFLAALESSTYVAKGGKTATAVAPAGTKASDAAKVDILASLGEPPPPADPGCGEFPGASPLC